MSSGSTLIDRCVVGTDVRGYSRLNPRRQADTQRDLQEMLADAADSTGLDRSAWELFPTGDGELAVLPAHLDLLAVVEGFVPALHRLLVLRNRDRTEVTRIRLRMAIHIGTLTPSISGHYAGTALVTLSRLLDSRPVRAALDRAEQSDLVLILSETVHQKVVMSGFMALGDEQFSPVVVDLPAKGFKEIAYVHIPGYDMRSFPRTDAPTETAAEAEDSEEPPGVPRSADTTSAALGGVVIHGSVHNEHGTIAGRDVYR